jgi:AbiV family abortive infection protein
MGSEGHIIEFVKLLKGAEICLKNAKRLLEDANILSREGRYPSGHILAMLSHEEVAKAFFLLDFYERGEDLSKKQWEKITKGRAHSQKLELIQRKEIEWIDKLLEEETKWTKDFSESLGKLARAEQVMKERLTYVDYSFPKQEWMDPEKEPAADKFNCQMRIELSEWAISKLEAEFKKQQTKRKN